MIENSTLLHAVLCEQALKIACLVRRGEMEVRRVDFKGMEQSI